MTIVRHESEMARWRIRCDQHIRWRDRVVLRLRNAADISVRSGCHVVEWKDNERHKELEHRNAVFLRAIALGDAVLVFSESDHGDRDVIHSAGADAFNDQTGCAGGSRPDRR